MTGDKPENCGVLSHHSNNKTSLLPTFQVHNLLTGKLICQRFLFTKKRCKKRQKRVFCLKKNKRKNVFFYIYVLQ